MTAPVPVAQKLIAPSSTTSVAIGGYLKISDGTAYTVGVGDGILILLNGTKATAGNSTITNPGTGWYIASAPSAGGRDSGSINDTAALYAKIATGSGDAPTFSVSTATWAAKAYVFAAGTFDPSRFPWDVYPPPQDAQTSILTASHPGTPLHTGTSNTQVIAFLALRGPAATSALSWTGATVDQALTGGSNNFLTTAMVAEPSPTTVTPSAAWTGGGGTVSTMMVVSIAPPGSVAAGTQAQVRVAGSPVTATTKVRVAGSAVAASVKVDVGGSPT